MTKPSAEARRKNKIKQKSAEQGYKKYRKALDKHSKTSNYETNLESKILEVDPLWRVRRDSPNESLSTMKMKNQYYNIRRSKHRRKTRAEKIIEKLQPGINATLTEGKRQLTNVAMPKDLIHQIMSFL